MSQHFREKKNQQLACFFNERGNSFISGHSTKQHEILNPVTQSEKAQEKFSSSIACDSSDKRERRSHDRKRSEPDKYEEQQRHRFLSTYTSPDRSFDHDPRRRFNSSRSRSFHGSRQNMKFNAAKRMMSVSNRKATDQEDLHLAIDSFRDRFEYQSSSPEHRRQSIRLPMCNRPTDESSYRDLWNRFKTGSNKKKHGTKTVTGLIAGRDR